MPEFEFIIVSKIITKDQIKSENIKLINGYWNENILDDRKIQEIYDQARLTILPTSSIRDNHRGRCGLADTLSRGFLLLFHKLKDFGIKKFC